MDDFERAAARMHSLARRLVRSGLNANDVSDALVVQGLALWSVNRGTPEAAEFLTRAWSEIRDSLNG